MRDRSGPVLEGNCALDAAMPMDERILQDPMLHSALGCYCCRWTGQERVEKFPGEQLMDAVRQDEREACAQIADDHDATCGFYCCGGHGERIGEAIRAPVSELEQTP